MSSAHADVPPDACPSCCRAFAPLVAHHAMDPDSPVPLAVIAAAAKLSERMTRLHLAHLVRHRRIESDRRTPVRGATVGGEQPLPEDVTPLAWAAWVAAPCRTCASLLRHLAVHSRGTWRGQISMAELAQLLCISEWTARMHVRTGHTAKHGPGHSLVAAGLVAFESVAEITGTNRHGRPVYVRRPDRFVLWPTQQKPSRAPLGGTWVEDQAADLLDRILWFDPTHAQAVWVVRLVGALLADGWPLVELERRLNVVPRTALPLSSPYLFARRRLPVRGEQFTRTMAEVIGAATSPDAQVASIRPAQVECPDCGRPPKPGGWCGGDLCVDPTWGTPPDALTAVVGADLSVEGRVPGGRRPLPVPAF